MSKLGLEIYKRLPPVLDPTVMRWLSENFRKIEDKALNKYGDEMRGPLRMKAPLIGGSDEWQTPNLLNGWAIYGSTWQQPVFRKEPGKVVRLKGLLSGTGATAGEIFQLPAGYRPFNDEIFLGAGTHTSTGAAYRIDIQPGGSVALIGGGSPSATPGYLSLSGITFGHE